MITDYVRFSFTGLRNRKLRSWLTMLGIFIGIAAVVALISISQGLQDSITEQFEMMGANKLIVTPGRGMGSRGVAAAEKLTSDDMEVVKKTKGVDMAAEFVYSTALVKFEDEARQTFVIGLPTDETADILKEMEGFETEKGRDLKNSDKEKVVIGYLVARDKEFFEKGVDLRDTLTIKGRDFKVVGVMQRIGNPQDDSQVYIPLDVAKELFEKEDEVDMVYVQIKSGFSPEEVAEEIKEELRDFRDEEEGEETFSVQTFEQLMETFSTIFNIVSAVLIGIAAISLLVGGIGIMNTMYTSVLERTREIGIMKAIGAKNSDILWLFLIESGMLGLAGGLIGIGIGIGIGKLVEIIAGMFWGTLLLKAHISWQLIVGALLFSFVVGALSGVLPARHASRLNPVDALRYE